MNLLKKLEGIQTVESVKDILNVSRAMAIYYIHKLRKEGYIKTKRLSNNKRVYNISINNKLGGTDYYEIINKNSPIKISTTETKRIYGKNVTIEETLIYAIKTKDLRTLLASLALFKKITNWSELYKLAKQNRALKKVGALYDLTRKIIKVRKMPKRFRNNALQEKENKYEFIIEKLKSNDFKDIEDKWKVFLPFNKKDLEDYK